MSKRDRRDSKRAKKYVDSLPEFTISFTYQGRRQTYTGKFPNKNAAINYVKQQYSGAKDIS